MLDKRQGPRPHLRALHLRKPPRRPQEGGIDVTNNDRCNNGHSEVQHKIMQLTEDIMIASVMSLASEVQTGRTDPASAGMISATMLFASALETGLRAALLDPIGAQIIIDHLNDRASSIGADLDEANRIIATDARQLLEAAARL